MLDKYQYDVPKSDGRKRLEYQKKAKKYLFSGMIHHQSLGQRFAGYLELAVTSIWNASVRKQTYP